MMNNKDEVLQRIAKALLMDYTSVYYINAVTNEYFWYSTDAGYQSLNLEPTGNDFFKDLKRDAVRMIHEEDLHYFLKDIQKDRLLKKMKSGNGQLINYRLLIDGKPIWHSLRIIRAPKQEDDYFVLGVMNIDEEYRKKLELEQADKEREIYNQIAAGLAAHYDTLYYVDIDTGRYFELSSTDIYKSMHIPTVGNDFFTESRKNIRKFVHPDDRERVTNLHFRKQMIKNLENTNTFTTTYRLVIGEKIMHCRYWEIWGEDRRHIIVCIENINAEVKAQKELKESKEKSVIYSQIAETLALKYDLLYYVDSQDNTYTEFTSNPIYRKMELRVSENDFFYDCQTNAEFLIYSKDVKRIRSVLNRDYFITGLEEKKKLIFEYRMILADRVQYTRMTVLWASDKLHFIIGVENIDSEIQKENEHAQALNMANELARKDELTGIRNKTAYGELEAELNKNIQARDCAPFAVVVCDINGLKHTNDTKGHKAGDQLICASSSLICDIFSHSPVFRIGGDEFVVILQGNDYSNRDNLFKMFKEQVSDNVKCDRIPIVACGMSDFTPQTDRSVSDIFVRSDYLMYNHKSELKSLKNLGRETAAKGEEKRTIPPERRKKLDELFEAFSVVGEGDYIYLCDMQYDFSRWSKRCVDAYALPSEYMYNAGDAWEDRIHPDDRKTYHEGVSRIFSGKAGGHDMQYRAQNAVGEYVICTCRGYVIKDEHGEPAYFAGVIRTHTAHGGIDSLTSLRNQYGFFEDLQGNINRNTSMRLAMIGIGKFSEINEVYGYHFGNKVLQAFARYLYQRVGNTGIAYRLDGTKFAVLSLCRNTREIIAGYETFRNHFRKGFDVEDRQVMLDLNAGVINVDHFEIDYQTAYSCLSFAYNESKARQHGDMVEFINDLNDKNRYRLEKLHAIRASIMNGNRGFYVMYQPVVDAKTEKVIGAEALLRWKSKEYGIVPPDHFIPILEADPLFPNLGRWILQKAINDTKLIMEKYPDFVIQVNLSYTQLEKADFVDMVMEVLEENEFPPEHLCFEITERCRLLDMELLKNVVTNLRGHGIKIALDDFGTGYSSVGLVKDLPFDTIKIDRSFVQKIEEDEKERELLGYFVSVAATFGARVCVEGVETAGMRDILQCYKVKSFQGYYYAKPLEFKEFLTRMGKRDAYVIAENASKA